MNINDTIIAVIKLIRTEVQRNHIMLRSEPSIELRLIMGDQVQLQQVILNRTMNAIEVLGDTTQEQRLLPITTAKDQSNGVVVEVRDSGTGLDVLSSGSLTPSGPPSPMAWEWDWQSAERPGRQTIVSH